MSLLTIESARDYVTDYFAAGEYGAETKVTIFCGNFDFSDGVPVVIIHGEYSDGSGPHSFRFDVWEEKRENGEAFLYGEW